MSTFSEVVSLPITELIILEYFLGLLWFLKEEQTETLLSFFCVCKLLHFSNSTTHGKIHIFAQYLYKIVYINGYYA